MYAFNTNPDNYQLIYPEFTHTQQQEFLTSQLEREINQVVAAVRAGENSWLILVDCVGYSERAIREAIRRGLVICVDGVLSLPTPAAEANNVEKATEQCVITNIDQIDQLETTITNCKTSQDKSLQVHANILEQCLHQDPWSQMIMKIETDLENVASFPPSPWPSFPGLELKNGESAKQYGYLVYTGSRADCIGAWRDCCSLQIPCNCKPNGKTGNWRLVVPLTKELELLEEQAA